MKRIIKEIVLVTLCFFVLCSESFLYSSTRSYTVLVNNLKKKIEKFLATKPDDERIEAEKLLASLSKEYDPEVVAALKEIYPEVVGKDFQAISPQVVLENKKKITEELDKQLTYPIDDEWHKTVDGLLFDLATIDRTIANQYSQKIREKLVKEQSVFITKIEQEKKETTDVPIVSEPIKEAGKTGAVPRGTPPSRVAGSGKKVTLQPKASAPLVMPQETMTPVKTVGSEKNPATVEEQLKHFIQEPLEKRTGAWAQDVKDLIFDLSVFDAKKAGMYLDEVYTLKVSKPSGTAVFVQQEPERPTDKKSLEKFPDAIKIFGRQTPIPATIKKMTGPILFEKFNAYLNALLNKAPNSWVKGQDGGRPALWWDNDIKRYAKEINNRKIDVRTQEEIEKEIIEKTTPELIAKAIQQQKEVEIKEVKKQIDEEFNKKKVGKTELQKSQIRKDLMEKKAEEIAKIKDVVIDEDQIKKEIEKEVRAFSLEKATQKIEATIARVRAEYQAEEKGFTLQELEDLAAELTEEIKAKNSLLSEKEVERLVKQQLPEAQRELLQDKLKEDEDLTKQLTEEIKKENSSLEDKDVRTEVRKRFPEAKEKLAVKKAEELKKLTELLTEQVRQSNKSLLPEDVQKEVKEQLKKVQKEQRVEKRKHREEESKKAKIDELIESLEKSFNEASEEPDSLWAIGVAGAIRELNRLDNQKAKIYKDRFFEKVARTKSTEALLKEVY